MDSNAFKKALGRFACGVTVVTMKTQSGANHGMTASAFTSLSLEPPLVLVCVKTDNLTHKHLKVADGFTVNLLTRDQEVLSNRFAGGTVADDGSWIPWPEEKDKFEGLNYTYGTFGDAPILEGTLAALDCIMHQAYEGGDHTVFIGRVEEAHFPDGEVPEPLLYFCGGYRSLAGND